MEELTSRIDLTAFAAKVDELRAKIGEVIIGQEEAVDLLLTALLADGHVLLEGVPGVAKTLLAKLTAKLIQADFSRIQFTPDLMPSDVLGTSVFNLKTSEFEFVKGPVFSEIVLIDEINRAPAKTQAALFEVMEERQVTVDGFTRKMDDVYMVVATQNPVEQEGTYRLPEAQLDRFLMKVIIRYPKADEELSILKRHNENKRLTKLEAIRPVLKKKELLTFRNLVSQVFVEESLLKYIADIVISTRSSKEVYLGASPRAGIAILNASKAYALLQGRDFIIPDDVKYIAVPVLQHRLMLSAEAEMEGRSATTIAKLLVEKIEVPK
jgi:MoxR-like ATPase